MTVFVDVHVIVYGRSIGDYRQPCLEILAAIARSEAVGRTSTAVMEELWHLELSGKAGDLDGVTRDAYTLFTPLLPTTDEAFHHALALDTPRLGANDRLHVGTCLTQGIDTILSADAGFDDVPGIIRIDPLDDNARRRVLGIRDLG